MGTDEHRWGRDSSFTLRVNVPGSAIPWYLCLSVLICGCSCFFIGWNGAEEERKWLDAPSRRRDWFAKRPGAVDLRPHPAVGVQKGMGELQVGVTCAQHGGETRDLFLAPAAFARLFKMPVITDFLQGSFAVDSFFQPAQGPIH